MGKIGQKIRNMIGENRGQYTRHRHVSILCVLFMVCCLVMSSVPIESVVAVSQDASDSMLVEQSDNTSLEEPVDDSLDVDIENNPVQSEEETLENDQSEGEEELSVLSFEGDDFSVTASLEEGAFPANTELVVSEIKNKHDQYNSLYDDTVKALEEVNENAASDFAFVRFYDITFVTEGEKIEPVAPVSVKIVYDKAIDISDVSNIKIVHFASDDKGEIIPEVLADDSVGITTKKTDDFKMMDTSFVSDSFSVYAIVDAPEPIIVDTVQIANTQELRENYNYTKGFYISYNSPAKYMTATVNNKGAFVETDVQSGGASWQLETVSGNQDTYFLYTMVGNTKKYITNTTGNEIGLTNNVSDAIAFVVSYGNSNGKFYFKKSDEDKWLQHSGSGSGMRLYDSNSNSTNTKLSLTYVPSDSEGGDAYGLDGKSYGIVYYKESSMSAAMMANMQMVSGQSRFKAAKALVRPNILGGEHELLLAEDYDVQEWMFHWVEADKYTISTDVGGVTKYIAMNGTSFVLVDDETDAIAVQCVPGSNANEGKWHFVFNNRYLNFTTVANGFNAVSSNADSNWLNLVAKTVLEDDDFVLYSAYKVSVSDTTNVHDGQELIIYTRVWNDKIKEYEYYILDHDGTLVKGYNDDDNIKWISGSVNTAIWRLTEYTYDDGTPNWYYELQNVQYGNYIAPQASDGQIMSDNTIGINLNGRRYGKTYTSIIAWDDANYQYAGLSANGDQVVSLPLSEATDFYFAILKPVEEQGELEPIVTVNNHEYGIDMKMIDFNNPLGGPNHDRDSVQHTFFGSHDNKFDPGLLTTNVDETTGYPTTTDLTGEGHHESLGVLFNDMTDVNHLFNLSEHDENGYFVFDSTKNSAYLNDDGNFSVYNELAAIGPTVSPTRSHGQFMPYNQLQPGLYAIDNSGNYITNQTDVLGQELPDSDPRKGERMYSIPIDDADYFFGMQMDAEFMQTESGLDSWGHDIIFEFSGDDDFWFYVDNELVIDLGGVRSAMTSKVNFRTGEVQTDGPITLHTANGDVENVTRYTLRQIFESNYRGRNPNATQQEVDDYLSNYFEDGENIFKDYTTHHMKMYYMERGRGASNLYMRFNLASVEENAFLLNKELGGTDMSDSTLLEFPYQIYYYSTRDGETTPHLLGDIDGEEDRVFYEGSIRTLNSEGMYREEFTPAGGTESYNHVFLLKPGETADVRLPDDATTYYVVECGINPDVYDKVTVNGVEVTGTPTNNHIGNTYRNDYPISLSTTHDRPRVFYVNHVCENAVRTLSITKKLRDINSNEVVYPDDTTPFSFRLYLGNQNTSVDNIPYANMYPYCVKDLDGYYCRWDTPSQSFVKIGDGISSYDDLIQYLDDNHWTASQKEFVFFKTSMYGSISKIPAGYTVEIRDLTIGCRYQVEERDREIPDGYSRCSSDGYARVDIDPVDEQETPYKGIIARGEDPQIEVRNEKGWGLVVEKEWTDEDFMTSHDDTYFAIYLRNGNALTLMDGSVRRLAHPETTLHYYFDTMQYNGEQHILDDFVVREVKLTGDIAVDDDGAVTNYSNLIPINEGGSIEIGGVPIGSESHHTYEYTVHYDVGDVTNNRNNMRIDTVTNSRPGISIYKTDWNGAIENGLVTNGLAGATFTLKDQDGNDVAQASYTSGEDGLITTAYLDVGSYILVEIKSPKGYITTERFDIVVDDDGNISIRNAADEYYVLDTTEQDMDANLLIKNKESAFRVKKIDSGTQDPLSGAHFALYRQVRDSTGNLRKDYLPIEGYEDMVTNSDGILTEITENLKSGTYYLTETSPPFGYDLINGDICFTVREDGKFVMNDAGGSGATISSSDAQDPSVMVHTLVVPNSSVIPIPTGVFNAWLLGLCFLFIAWMFYRRMRVVKDNLEI